MAPLTGTQILECKSLQKIASNYSPASLAVQVQVEGDSGEREGQQKTPCFLAQQGCAFLPTAADCVRLSVQNLSKLADTLPAPEVSEAVSLILNFVRDSYPISSALLLEFENGEGYPLLLKVLLR